MSRIVLLVLSLLLPLAAWATHGPHKECACGDDHAHHNIDELLACHSDPVCESEKLGIEIALQFKGRDLVEAMKSYLRLSNNPILVEEDRLSYVRLVQQSKQRLRGIASVTPFKINEELIEPLFLDFDYPDRNYHRYYNAFNLGFEYVSLENISQSAFPRIGVFFYRRYGDTPTRKEGFGNYGVHLKVAFQLTSSAEQVSSADEDQRLSNTLDAIGEVYLPRFHSSISLDHTLGDYIGPLFVYNVKKIGDRDRVVNRFYGGLRTAINPEVFFDVLFGVTQDINSTRMELRGQLPLYKFSQGTRVFFGSTINMGLPWENKVQDKDVVRFYLDWNADFEKIISGFSAAVGI